MAGSSVSAPAGYRSPLNVARAVDYDAMKRNAYRDQRILIVNLDDPRLNWADRQILENVGERLYGKASSRS